MSTAGERGVIAEQLAALLVAVSAHGNACRDVGAWRPGREEDIGALVRAESATYMEAMRALVAVANAVGVAPATVLDRSEELRNAPRPEPGD